MARRRTRGRARSRTLALAPPMETGALLRRIDALERKTAELESRIDDAEGEQLLAALSSEPEAPDEGQPALPFDRSADVVDGYNPRDVRARMIQEQDADHAEVDISVEAVVPSESEM